MISEQSKLLKIGQRVAWRDNTADQRTIAATNCSGDQITWDNGKDQFLHHNDMGEVEGRKGAP
mgnify:CR=1 FL=1